MSGVPKVIGLMACNDDRSRDVLEACRAANLAVPEEDINVEEMTNTIFAGAEAACCSMQVDQTPLNGLMERLRNSKTFCALC